MSDEHLDDAFGALRERWDGEAPEAEATLRAALVRTRKKRQSRTAVRWIAMPLAAALCVATAWAAVSGRGPFAPTDAKHGELAPPSLASPAPSAVPSAQAPPRDEPAPAAAATASSAASPTESPAVPPPAAKMPAGATPAALAERPAAVSVAPGSAAAASASSDPSPAAPEEPNAALFAEAHKLHFVHKDPARALLAWDAYLRTAPDGRFAPEARYNRALTLLRLGRNKEAREALEPFASGAFGTYRRDDARALLDALDR